MKLRQRMLVVILGSILVILAGMLTYIGNRSHQMAVDSATALASTSGEKIAATVQNEIEAAMDTARTIAESLESMKSNHMTDRNVVNGMLKRILEDNPAFLGTWTLWEPNAFDGLDERFANTEATDQTGRLITYWTRTGSAISLTISEGYEQPGVGDYYLLARNSGNLAEELNTTVAIFKIK